jgi:hypothetical protein
MAWSAACAASDIEKREENGEIDVACAFPAAAADC